MSDYGIDHCANLLSFDVVGSTGDEELDRLFDAERDLLHTMAARIRGDVDAEEYAQDVAAFKSEWLHRTASQSLATYVDALQERCDELKEQLRGEIDAR